MKRKIFFMICVCISFLTGCDINNGNHLMKYSGTLEMTEHSVGLAAAGILTNVFVEEGDAVTKGQRLAILEHYEQAKKDFERAQKLLQSGGVSQQDFEHLKEALEDEQILSPVDGIVLTKVRESGEAITAGSPVLIIGENNKIWVKIYVPENEVSQVSLKQKARIRIDGLQNEVPGYINYISFKAEFTPRNVQTPQERATQMFGVKVMLENPVNAHPGVSADVVILNNE